VGILSKKVSVVMGSDSDLPVIKKCLAMLDKFGVPYEAHVISAHRTPAQAEALAKGAEENGVGVIIAAAGKAAHLGGVLAAYTTLPVIGLPIKSSTMDGLDSLLSIVQMPKGIPVATVAIDGAENAGILATQILALSDEALAAKLKQYKIDMANEVMAKDAALQKELGL
jgi:5-(carboxyamino)imidazole ribonucleotide mutase